MSSQSSPSSLSSRLAALAQRLGLGGRAPRLLESASQLRLPFQQLKPPAADIWWQNGPPLQRLVDLPRNALSGPVQEDKAQAHAVLIRVVELEQRELTIRPAPDRWVLRHRGRDAQLPQLRGIRRDAGLP